MHTRKLAIDPLKFGAPPGMTSDSAADLTKDLNKMRRLVIGEIISKALIGDVLRTAKALGCADRVINDSLVGNALAAEVHMRLIDRLESLIREGYGLTAAQYKLLGEKWLIRIDNLEMGDSGCCDQQEADENE